MRATGRKTTRRDAGAASGARAGDRRGQTTIDFAVGISVFLVSLAFVFAFVPGMLSPFVGGSQSDLPAANRVADDLAQRTLGNASDPYVLDAECTRIFFAGEGDPDCQFDDAPLTEQVGVVDRTNLQVTISGDLDGDGTELLCWDDPDVDEAGRFVEESNAECDDTLDRGSDPAGSGGKTVSARRVASLDGQDVTIEVIVW